MDLPNVASARLKLYPQKVEFEDLKRAASGCSMNKAFIRVGRMATAAGAMVLGLVRDLLASSPDAGESNSRQLHDADLVGEYNHRTGRLDAGNDPYGWYDED